MATIEFRGSLQKDEVRRRALTRLCERFRSVVSERDFERLHVIVVPDTQVESAVNDFVRSAGIETRYHGDASSQAVAIALDGADGFEPRIVLGVTVIGELSTDFAFPARTVSTVLEEFLHVLLYSRQHERCGRVQLGPSDGAACEVDLLTMARMAGDEYIVARLKTQIAQSVEVAQPHAGADLQCLTFRYDPPTPDWFELLREAVMLEAVIRPIRGTAWTSILTALYRKFLYPLAHYVGNADALSAPGALPTWTAVPPAVAAHIPNIVSNFRRIASTELLETEDVARENAEIFRQILSAAGTTFVAHAGGSCTIHVRSTW